MHLRLVQHVRPLGLALLGAVLGALLVSGADRLTAHNAPLTAGIIHACVNAYGVPSGQSTIGAVRIVPATENCRPGETAFDWSKGVASCPSGQILQALNPDGTSTCVTDQNTSYTAGAGLSLSGTQFSADTSYLQRRVGSGCTSGSTIQAIGQDGSVTCKSDAGLTAASFSYDRTEWWGAGGAASSWASKSCASTETLVGGGVETSGGDLKVRQSYPDYPNNRWYAQVRNDDPFNSGQFRVYVICVPN